MPIGGDSYGIEAVISVRDDTQKGMTQASNTFKSFGARMDDLAAKMIKVDRAQNRAFNSLAAVGAMMSGPLLLAAKNAADRNENLRMSFDRMADSSKRIADVLGKAMEPVIRSTANSMNEMAKVLASLDPEFLKSTVTIAMWVSGILIAAAAVNRLTDSLKYALVGLWKLISVIVPGAAAFNPWVLAIVAVISVLALLITQWDKVQKFIIPVLNFIEVNLRNAANAFLTFYVTPVLFGLDLLLTGWQKFAAFMGLLPSVVGGAFRVAAGAAKEAHNEMDKLQKLVDKIAASNRGKMKDAFEGIFTGEKGDLASEFEKLHIMLEKFMKKHKEMVEESITGWDDFQLGVKSALDEALKTLGTWKTIGVKIVNDMSASMQRTWTSVFTDMFTGKLSKAKDYFRMFGESIVKMFAEVCAQIVTRWLLVQMFTQGGAGGKPSLWGIALQVVGAIGTKGTGAATSATPKTSPAPSSGGRTAIVHSGGLIGSRGVVYAHGGLSPDEVPAVLQTGEGVLSRRGMSALGTGNLNRLNSGQGGKGGDPVVVVIQAWDTRDLQRNAKYIETLISGAMKRNTSLRADVRNYTR